MKRYLLLGILWLWVLCVGAQFNFLLEQPAPKYEVRGVWLTTYSGLDWPKTKANTPAQRKKQQAELCQMLDQLQQVGINTVFFQTRIRGSVSYASKYEPWDATFTGTYDRHPGYDPLAFAIEECHRRGMELHAWVVAIPYCKTAILPKMGKKVLTRTQPQLLKRHDGQYYLDPGQPGTASYLSTLCQEIVKNYDVDGIHLDYIRYPENAEKFSDASTYKKYGKGKTRADWRRANVTTIVQRIYRDVKGLKPWVRVSCSPVGKHADVTRYSARGWSAWGTVYQEAQKWLDMGVMDMLCPMVYFKDNHFFPFVADWQEQSRGRIVSPGLGIYFLNPKEKNWPLDVVLQQLAFIRRESLMGQVYFRVQHLLDNTKGLYDYLKDTYYAYPALTPCMSWQDSLSPAAPTLISKERINRLTEKITWKPVSRGGSYCRYVVYASKDYPVNLSDARNIVQITYDTSYTYNLLHSTLNGLHIAITAVDRWGNESEPLHIEGVMKRRESIHPWGKDPNRKSLIY